MALPALATFQQMTNRARTPLPAGAIVEAALVDASATVRSYTGQEFTRRTSTERLRVDGHVVELAQRPVISVASCLDVAGNAVAVTWDGLAHLTFTFEPWALDAPLPSRVGVVDVTYEHGYDDVPDEIATVVCNIAARALAAPPEQGPVTSQTITNFAQSFGPVGAAGPAGIFNDERAILDRYRREGATIWLSML